ncbi:D-arabinose 1-dehydrogenase [Morus notabilis]|uniref:D-arabinose 1-dehydrogenase n=1 Tax=Morus notabilis TaxID=981085 RepID=W9QBM1_9ROSA|nr:D-arabinose 1-dehydrogenase [Morus notabilis]
MASSDGKLELRTLGNTGLKLSCVGFGASPLGNVFGPVSQDDADASVREAFRLGINFFDTSPYYGGTLSEKVLGKALKALGVPRNEYIVSTKCGRYAEGFDFSAERVTKSVDESLARLQLDYVDILQCHDIEFGSLDQIPALQKLKEAGKIRFIGITGLPLDIFTYVLDRVPPGAVDVILSYCHYSINDSTLDDLMPYLKSKGIGVISASPLAMGLLTESGPPEWHPASAELKSACQAAAAFCKEKGKNISKLAMQYSLSNKDISSVLVGMNSVRQVEENAAAAVELANAGKDEDTLLEVEAILKPRSYGDNWNKKNLDRMRCGGVNGWSTDNPLVFKAAKFAVNHFNKDMEKKLQLKKVIRAHGKMCSKMDFYLTLLASDENYYESHV